MPRKDKEEARRISRERYQNLTPEQKKEYQRKGKEWRKNNPDKVSKSKSKYNATDARKELYLKSYGWSSEAVESAKATQNERCAICNEIVPLVPDHEHCEPPKPRELLCKFCNSGIGFLKDDPKLCELAAAYLRKWGKA